MAAVVIAGVAGYIVGALSGVMLIALAMATKHRDK